MQPQRRYRKRKEEKDTDLKEYGEVETCKRNSRNFQRGREKKTKNKMKDQHFKKEIGFYARGKKSKMSDRELSFSYKSHYLFGNNHFT